MGFRRGAEGFLKVVVMLRCTGDVCRKTCCQSQRKGAKSAPEIEASKRKSEESIWEQGSKCGPLLYL